MVATKKTNDTVEVGFDELRPFDAQELPNLLVKGNSTGTPTADAPSSVPAARESGDFTLGQIVWYSGPGRPSWPARIQLLPPDQDDANPTPTKKTNKYRIQLYNTQGGAEDGEVLPAESSQLLALENHDAPAYSQVMQIVQKDLAK